MAAELFFCLEAEDLLELVVAPTCRLLSVLFFKLASVFIGSVFLPESVCIKRSSGLLSVCVQVLQCFQLLFPLPADFHVPSEYLTNIHIRDKVCPPESTRKTVFVLVVVKNYIFLYIMSLRDFMHIKISRSE